MFLVALSQMFDCRKPLDDLHDDTHEMGRLQILSTQVQIYQGRRLMEASIVEHIATLSLALNDNLPF